MKNKRENKIAGVMLLLLFSGLFPILFLGRFSHPTGDDYYYCADTFLTWTETGNLVSTLQKAAQGVQLEYHQWQGTYSALFLMHLSPHIFGDFWYRMVPVFVVGLLLGGIFYLCVQVNDWLTGCKGRQGTPEMICFAAVISLFCIEFVPSCGETFYWYNGAMYYTGFMGGTLFFLGLLLKWLRKGGRLRIGFLLLLAFFLAGGNYVTLLPCLLLVVCLLGVYLLVGFAQMGDAKEEAGQERQHRRRIAGICAVLFCLLLGLFLSAAAPGNQLRQDGMWKIPAWKAIVKSLLQGGRYLFAWCDAWWLFGGAVLTPILWKYYEKLTFRFPYPAFVVGISYGIFCSMSCPLFYTMNSTGPARAVAVVFYGFSLFTFFSYAYLLGYWKRRMREDKSLEERIGRFLHRNFKRYAGVLYVFGVLLLVWCGCRLPKTNSAEACRELVNGEAARYEEEYQLRKEKLLDETMQRVQLTAYRNRPQMIYVGDFSPDETEPTNQKVAQFYKKEAVWVKYESDL